MVVSKARVEGQRSEGGFSHLVLENGLCGVATKRSRDSRQAKRFRAGEDLLRFS